MTEAIQDNSIDKGYELASISSRFWAEIIDSIILTVIMRMIFHYFPQEGIGSFLLYIYYWVISMIISFLVNYSFLRCGQTIGMRFLGIQFTDTRGNIASIWRIFFLGQVIFGIILFLIKMFGLFIFYYYYELNDIVRGLFELIIIIDLIFIFREDRRTLHDHFAGTIVIKLSRKAHNANPSNMEGKTNEIFI